MMRASPYSNWRTPVYLQALAARRDAMRACAAELGRSGGHARALARLATSQRPARGLHRENWTRSGAALGSRVKLDPGTITGLW